LRVFVSVVLVFVYIWVGAWFHFGAMAGRVDPERPAWGTDLFRRELFTPDGQRPRRAALRFYAIGGFALLLCLWLLAA